MKIEEERIEDSKGNFFGKKGKPIHPKIGLDTIGKNSKYVFITAVLGIAIEEGLNNFMTYLSVPFLGMELMSKYYEKQDNQK